MHESLDKKAVLFGVMMLLGSALLGFAVNVSRAQDKAVNVVAVIESCSGLLSCTVSYELDGPRTGTYVPPEGDRPVVGEQRNLVIYDPRTNRLYDSAGTREITLPVGVGGAALLLFGSVNLYKHWRTVPSQKSDDEDGQAP